MVYVARAQIYASSGDDRAALQDLNAAVKINPKSAQALVARGYRNASKGKHEEVIADLTHAITIDAHDLIAYSNRTMVGLASGRRTWRLQT